MFVSSHIEYAIKSLPQQMIDSHIPHMHDAKARHCGWMCACVCACVHDERVVPTPGISSVMKHSKGVARGVYSTPGCKMKLWKSNLLHSQRPIAFITTKALNERLYFTKINITVGHYFLPVGGSKWSFAYLIHACSKVVHKILLGFLQSMSYVQCFHSTHNKLR